MKVIRMPVGIYAANCYLIYDEISKEGIIVDPGGDEEDIINKIEELGLKIKTIVLTHGHGDHIAAVLPLKEYTKANVAVHKDDAYLLKDGKKNYSSSMAMGTIEFEADTLLEENDVIEFGNISCRVIHTPGHTPGGICLEVENCLFTGDTLFAGSIGRTDFEGGSYDEIINSIKTKLIVFPDDTKVYPGHGPSTTIKMEKMHNPFLR